MAGEQAAARLVLLGSVLGIGYGFTGLPLTCLLLRLLNLKQGISLMDF